jgi:hypothetical protein
VYVAATWAQLFIFVLPRATVEQKQTSRKIQLKVSRRTERPVQTTAGKLEPAPLFALHTRAHTPLYPSSTYLVKGRTSGLCARVDGCPVGRSPVSVVSPTLPLHHPHTHTHTHTFLPFSPLLHLPIRRGPSPGFVPLRWLLRSLITRPPPPSFQVPFNGCCPTRLKKRRTTLRDSGTHAALRECHPPSLE